MNDPTQSKLSVFVRKGLLAILALLVFACGDDDVESRKKGKIPTDIPVAPTGITLEPGNTLNTLKWGSIYHAQSYTVYWRTTPGVSTGDASYTVGLPSFGPVIGTHSGLTNGTIYYYAVTASNLNGESPLSGEVAGIPGPPPTPTGIVAIPGSAKNTLYWNGTAVTLNYPKYYTIYWDTAPGVTTASSKFNKSTPLAANSALHSGLTNGTTYYYAVSSSNNAGESGLSAEVSATASPEFFHETFADNSQGWTLGPEWEIGPAVPYFGIGAPDPSVDVTASADNGVAGVGIGTNYTYPGLHGFYYLTSPVIDTTGFTGTLTLDFFRWLSSDYTPYVNNVVEVWNGGGWFILWQSGGFGIYDPNWNYIPGETSFDISGHSNANFQVRFGFDIGNSGLFLEGGWNLDEVWITDQ